MRPGAKVAISPSSLPKRKTRSDTIAIFNGRLWISIDSRVPNELVREALQTGGLREFRSYSQISPEYAFRHSRFDFLLNSKSAKCLLEVKSCTLVENKIAKFPDAPTERGLKHLHDLINAKRLGHRACILFVIQRSDAVAFVPNTKADPQFGKTLKFAKQ